MLPKIDKPLFEDVLPVSGDKIYYRPFTVKEEKILLIGQQSDDFNQAVLAMIQVINNCVSYKDRVEAFDVAKMPIFVLEYLLIKIRSKSEDDTIPLTINDAETEQPVKVVLNLNDVKLQVYEGHQNTFPVSDEYSLVLKYPTVEMLPIFTQEELTEAERSYNVMVGCLDKLVSEENVYEFTEETPESIADFLGDLPRKALTDIKNFFDTAPRMRHEIKYTNSLGNEKTLVIEGTETFFI